ncbi:hypothetical protein OGH69_01185 [Flavobacterium sp. MFBS3-15]|uniref:hypothetical protein n=1 Tax=Flavobacterium sp. MFBS3-15 TaxID=2989816 RepID=UPI0022359D8B|nr:hypothetical protein [Flavobacterium sp. MFBS3-15]MCW4467569.1 hypothetical protein [Flavobacterium sp. MFBS3-15]
MKYLCLFLIFSVHCFSQNKDKKVYYFDENWKPTTEHNFKKNQSEEYITRYFDMDTAYIAKTFLFENYGKLQQEQYQGVKKHLENISGRILDTTKPIVISYISLNDPSDINPNTRRMNIYDTSRHDEMKKMDKRTDINLIWLQHAGNEPEKGRYRRNIDWYFDKDDYIAKTFLEYNCHIGSLIIIMPDGSYLSYYCIEKILHEANNVIDKMKKGT